MLEIGLAVVAVIAIAYYVYSHRTASGSGGAQVTVVTPQPPAVVVDSSTKPALRQIGTGDDSVAAVLFTETNYGGTPHVLDLGVPVTICQQRNGQLTWLFQSLKLNPGSILEISSQAVGARYYKGIGFLAVESNVPNLTTLTTVYPGLKGSVWNNLDAQGTWAMTGPALFADSAKNLSIDYTIKLVDQSMALQDAQSVALDCAQLAGIYGYTGDRKTLTCALPDPIGSLNLGNLPTVSTVRNYVTPGLI